MMKREPYRSKRREEPRYLFPSSTLSEEKIVRPKGYFGYSEDGPRLSIILKERKTLSRQALKKTFKGHPEDISRTLDALYFLACRYIRPIVFDPYAVVNPAQDVLMPCFHKSLLSLLTAYQLTMEGLWGPARLNLRLVYESLMIGKYCSVNPEADVFDRWVDGVDIYFTNAVLKKINTRGMDSLQSLWKTLCVWSHSSLYAGQPISVIEDEFQQVLANFSLMYVFVAWQWHLLMRHMVTRSVRYYGDAIFPREPVRRANRQLSAALRRQFTILPTESKRLVSAYRATWKVF